jgi:biopolymer transport protein ExbD
MAKHWDDTDSNIDLIPLVILIIMLAFVFSVAMWYGWSII